MLTKGRQLEIEMLSTITGSELEKVTERSVKWVRSGPITFLEFLDMFGPKDYVELIDGAVVEKPMVQLDYEKLLIWLLRVMAGYVEEKNLGIVLASRSAVQINEYGGRLPDLFFVRSGHMQMVQQKATFGAPDLVIEIISSSDRRAGLIALEADYRSIGVTEIVFIDQKRKRIRILRRQNETYKEDELRTGILRLETVEGFWVDAKWLFTEPRPAVRKVLDTLLVE